ncbi:hypothetical protein NM208_g6590 [Fusarium decemcellulare]|uniref:Uncharacterized protein n=1 Tax=Fusarium decemcellulare TaxID=57161 RepID=A0ACC1SCN7_9HYPO|nr:hypothetical protein NM208_g6590 [Fusarium decemcellulare]
MRFSIIFSITLAANAVAASRCKPRPSSDSSATSVESTTSTAATESATTSTEVETTTTDSAVPTTTIATTTTTSAEFSTSTATSTTADDTTTASTTMDTTSSQTDTTSSELSVSTTTTATTTTSEASEPIATFDVLASGSQVDGQYLSARPIPGYMMGWNLQGVTTARLSFSIDPITKYAVDSSGYYWCVTYGGGSQPNFFQLCEIGAIAIRNYGFLTCDQTADHKLECSVPAASCVDYPYPSCTRTGGTFSQFYAYSGRSDGVFLAIASTSNPPTANTYQAIELEITAH